MWKIVTSAIAVSRTDEEASKACYYKSSAALIMLSLSAGLVEISAILSSAYLSSDLPSSPHTWVLVISQN